MTPETKAKIAATRKLNAERKAWHLANDAAFKVEQDRHAAKVAKIKATADDVRGNENERTIAAGMIEQVQAKAPTKQRSPWAGPELPRTIAEWETHRKRVRAATRPGEARQIAALPPELREIQRNFEEMLRKLGGTP